MLSELTTKTQGIPRAPWKGKGQGKTIWMLKAKKWKEDPNKQDVL